MKTKHRYFVCWTLLTSFVFAVLVPRTAAAQNKKLTEAKVLKSINLAIKSLQSAQLADGSWKTGNHVIGSTALVTLALLNAGVSPENAKVAKALRFLRDAEEPNMTYEVSLVLMVLSMINDKRDRGRMQSLVTKLERSQIQRGDMRGCWSYFTNAAIIDTGGDRSNGQFAILGLYEAANAGIHVDRDVWKLAKQHWENTQNGDGGWGYAGPSGGGSRGSMTVAGIASMVMTSAMLQDDSDVDAKGNPNCCKGKDKDKTLERGLRWLHKRVQFGANPGGGGWLMYYLYGLERAGRLSGRRFFGSNKDSLKNDWYRQGARFLVNGHNPRTGFWDAKGAGSNPILNSSFALLFLSKGLAPVLINKLKFDSTSDDTEAWNFHAYDVRNLTNRITGMDKWPKLVTWQVVDIEKVVDASDLMQSPVLYLSCKEAPKLTDPQIELLKQYVNLGGFIFAVNNCQRAEFHDAMFQMVNRMYPDGEVTLERLKKDHAIFKSEYSLDGDVVELFGADFGCRTAIVYSPDDIGCLMNKWSKAPQPDRKPVLKGRVERAMRIGINAVAYATGREPPNKLRQEELTSEKGAADNLNRGLLQVAQVRHTGGWDTAPKAARNLLLALNRTVGMTASTTPTAITPTDKNLNRYSMLVMHGRHRFSMTDEEVKRLREYLDRGGVLFADACCGSSQFDQSFRELVRRIYPDDKLDRIPVDHELFSTEIGHDLSRVRRRAPEASDAKALEGNVIMGAPFVEGVEIDKRLVLIYSKYDISCALERQASVACTGYLSEDAVRIAVNIVLYSKLQRPPATIKKKR